MVVLDANILIRAVLGRRVRHILEIYFTRTRFFTPDTAIAEAREHLPEILLKRGIDPESALAVFGELLQLIGCIDVDIYGRFETKARKRLERRDEEDWPVLATALALECTIWTEDPDFFGAGIATWTTDRIELLLSESRPETAEPNQAKC
jgi:predicted nucleic acid-binding protein